MVSDSRFDVANVGGVWRLLLLQGSTLDYETEQSLALTIKVADTGMPTKESNSETITINVGNANDNPPVFGAEQVTWQSGFANGAVAETTDGSVTPVHIATVNARDPDRAVVSSFGVLTYSLANDYGKFAIDDAGVITLTAKLDREGANPDPAEYSLLATISDGDASITTDPIIVKVLHVDESDPEFDDAANPVDWELAFAGGRITEGTYTNERIGTLAASDADSDAELTYSIVSGGGGLFSIKSGTNQLILNGVLDYDTATGGATSHTLIFGVSDGSGAVVQSDPYTINVVDENDNDPQFGAVRWVAGTVDLNDANIVTIDEGSTGNLLTIPVTDADTGGALQLSILSGNANDADGDAIFTFAASGGGGLLTISGDLDYESATKSYTLELQVEDDGGRTDPHSVTINVKDINDNAPTMTLSGNSVINERLATDTGPIVAGITITIADADATDAHKSSVSGGPALTFTVYEADGTTVNNDYAVVRKAGGAVNEYQLQHTGDTLDASTTSSVALKIGVTDGVNSDPPQLPVTLTVNHVDEGDVMALELDAVYEQHPATKEITTFAVPTGFSGATLTLSSGTLDNNLFTIRDGKLWWISTPDYESPTDADRDNVYEIEVTFTKTDGSTTTRQRYDLEVQNIGPGRYGYDSSKPDGGARTYTHHYPDVPLPEEPGGLSNYILGGHAFVTPEMGPLILTWAHDPDSEYTAAQVRPIVERAFAMYEVAANFKFIEVDWSASKDIEMLFNQGANTGRASPRHKFISAQVDRIRVSSQTIEDLETDYFDIVLHEIGHIIGLKHPFEEDLEARPVGEWLWDQDHYRNPNTIMSYYNFNNDPDRGDELLPADIAALRFLYGPPEGTAGAEDWEPPHWLVRSNNFRVNPSPSSEPIFISETAVAGTELYTITVENNFLLRYSNPPTPARSEYELPNGSFDNEFFQLDSVTGVLSLKQKLDYSNPLDQGNAYLYTGNNVYEVRINGRHFFDDAATQAIWGNTTEAQYVPIVVLESIDLATEGLTDINLVTRGAAKTPTDYIGKEVIGTDGVNRISDGHGYDIIRGNGNDDIITLTTTPKDENKVIYRIGNQVALDGGDQVTGFERGKDELILALPENMTTSAITNFAGFVSHINGGTPTDLTDDWFGVKLVTDAGKTMLEGLSFHFEKIVVGAGSSSVMHITFSTSVPLSDALGSTTLASITNSDGFLTNFGLLDDLLGGEQSFKFITEEFTIPTNTMAVRDAVYEQHPVTKEITTFAVPSGFAGATLALSSGTLDNNLFTIRDGKLWWISTPDYESPADADRDNVYEIEVTFTKTDDTTTRQRYDLEVQDIGPGRYGYGSSNRDGGSRTYLHHRPDIPLPEEPGGLSNYILDGHAFVTPETGALILTWAHDPVSGYTAAQVRPIVERALAMYEAAANFKFIEVDSSASKDIEMRFKQGDGGGIAFSRHNSNAQMDRIRVSSQTIEELETDYFDTLIHEIGHIIGLKHPFDESREGEWSWDEGHRHNPNTIMSYSPNRGNELLPADIAALRFLYGPPEGTAGAEDWEPPHWLVRSNHFRLIPSLPSASDPIFISETAAAGTELYTITVENNFLLRFSNPPTPARSEFELPNGSLDNEFFQLDSVTGVLSLKQKLDYGNPLDQGNAYLYTGNNVYEVTINGRHFFDDEAIQAIWGNTIFAQYLPIVVLESIDLATEGLTDINLETRGAAKTPTDYGGKEVIGTDGVNRISDGHGYDIIRGNGNDDIITLTTTPKDENKVIYRIGNQVAIDGGDQVTGFERGKDELILALPENMTTSAITNFAGFVSHINGGTSTDLTDDWFGVKLVTDAGKTVLEGLSFHFEKIVVGAGSSSVMHITFSTSVPLSEVLGSTTLASITNSDGYLTDFGLLDDLLGGEQSFKFITEEFTIPTNTMAVGGDLNDRDPSSTAPDDLLGGAVFLGFEII